MQYFIWFLLISKVFNGFRVLASTSNNIFQIYRLANGCPEHKVPMALSNVSIKLVNSTYFVRFDVMVYEDLSPTDDIKSEFELTRCSDKSAPSTCEKYHKVTFPYFCKFMKLRGPWTLYLDSMIPPFRCPIKKGNYQLQKSIACDMKQIERLKLARGYYFLMDIKHYGMSSNKLLFCAKCEGQG